MVLVRHDHRFGTHSARAIMVRCDGMVLGVPCSAPKRMRNIKRVTFVGGA